jgi:hypothetical protein
MTDIVSFDPESESASTESIDPAALAERSSIDYCEETYTHEERDHCEAGAAGRAIVGVTDGESDDDVALLLCLREGGDHAILPNGIVDTDEEWMEAAREAVETLGVAVELGGVERVRRVAHVHEDGSHLDTTHHVVLRGFHPTAERDGHEERDGPGGRDAPTDRDEPAIACDDEWTATWAEELPVDLDRESDNDGVFADIRLFAE